jgi:hypothetical protein
METLIGILLISIAAISEAIMDKTQFHYHRSIFRYWKYQQFFDPAISWKNKWKNQDPREGERFSFSSTILVAFTDAWHLFKMIRNVGIFGGLLLLAVSSTSTLYIITLFVIARIIYGIIFTIFFSRVFEKR